MDASYRLEAAENKNKKNEKKDLGAFDQVTVCEAALYTRVLCYGQQT